MKPYICEQNGKWYIRLGECNRCGECCLGWLKPCPYLQTNEDFTTTCLIHERLAEKDDERVLEDSRVLTTQCAKWPLYPSDINTPILRNKCGYTFMELPKVLVTCPTHEVKEYCFQEWIDNVTHLTYPLYDVLVVDNSPTEDFMNRWKDKIPMEHIVGDPAPEQWLNRICQSMARVQEWFLAGNYGYWMNIEVDNIPPKNIIELLLEKGKGADWTSHAYPVRTGSIEKEQGIGCSLLSRKLMTDFNWKEAADSPDAELWNFVREKQCYKTVELWDHFEVKHLKA